MARAQAPRTFSFLPSLSNDVEVEGEHGAFLPMRAHDRREGALRPGGTPPGWQGSVVPVSRINSSWGVVALTTLVNTSLCY